MEVKYIWNVVIANIGKNLMWIQTRLVFGSPKLADLLDCDNIPKRFGVDELISCGSFRRLVMHWTYLRRWTGLICTPGDNRSSVACCTNRSGCGRYIYDMLPGTVWSGVWDLVYFCNHSCNRDIWSSTKWSNVVRTGIGINHNHVSEVTACTCVMLLTESRSVQCKTWVARAVRSLERKVWQ